MYIYDFALRNRELLKFVYTIIVGLICFIIVIKTDRLFRLSFHQGIRYFRNAFFFYGLAFVMRYLLSTVYFLSNRNPFYASIMKIVFEFFLIMAGFSLLYSLLWKKLEIGEKSFSSLFNTKIALFYTLAFIVALLDYLWKTYSFMFLLQITLFSYVSIISYINYKKSKEKEFLKLYFIVMLINLVAWLSNFFVATFFNWHQGGIMGIYFLNTIIFLLFLYGVMKVTKKSDNL